MDDTSCAGALKAFTPLEVENRRKRDYRNVKIPLFRKRKVSNTSVWVPQRKLFIKCVLLVFHYPHCPVSLCLIWKTALVIWIFSCITRTRNKFTSSLNYRDAALSSLCSMSQQSLVRREHNKDNKAATQSNDHHWLLGAPQSSFSSLSMASSSSVRSESIEPISWRTSPADLKMAKVCVNFHFVVGVKVRWESKKSHALTREFGFSFCLFFA